MTSTTTKMWFKIIQEGTLDFNYVDLNQCLSIVNRRSYRQATNVAVQGITIYAKSQTPPLASPKMNCYVQTIPKTWVADNATTMAFEQWKDQRAEVLKVSPSLKSRWSDFKLFMDENHVQRGTDFNLTPSYFNYSPLSMSTGLFQRGEWDASQIVFPDETGVGPTQECTMHVVGDHLPPVPFDDNTTSIGLITSYALQRALPMSPDPVLPANYNRGPWTDLILHDDMSEEVTTNLVEHNNEPPYAYTHYPGGIQNANALELTALNVMQNYGDENSISMSRMGPFICPFGLMKINTEVIDAIDYEFIIEIDVVPGPEKGILSERGV
jgi:hypothetical protein